MASALSAAVPVSPPRTGGIERTAMLVEKLNPSHAAFIRKDYAAAKAHKAIASHVPAGRVFHWAGVDSAARAQRRALEGCQARYASGLTVILPSRRATAAR